MPKYELRLFADYFQFYIQDDDEKFGDLSDAWTDEAVRKLLAVSDHVVGIGTVRNMDVSVVVTTSTTLPTLAPNEWDRINETSITCETGRLVVAGCTDYFPDALRIPVKPGRYDVVIGYRDLETLSEDRLDGDDSYHVFLAPRNGK